MKFWRPGITGKLFLAIFATCIVLLISMHWAVRISFERGFIDYIKHGNEQRLQLLSDALGEQYAQHGNWRFLRNNDRFVFQILRSFEHDNSEDKPGPGMPPHGWRTQFWVVDQNNKVLVGPRAPIPPDGTRRPILVNGAEVGAVIASPVERLTRNTDINFDKQQRQTTLVDCRPGNVTRGTCHFSAGARFTGTGKTTCRWHAQTGGGRFHYPRNAHQ